MSGPEVVTSRLFIEDDGPFRPVTQTLFVQRARELYRMAASRFDKGVRPDVLALVVQGPEVHSKARAMTLPRASSAAHADPVGAVYGISMLLSGVVDTGHSADPRLAQAHELCRAFLRDNIGRGK